jgi:hypothetical protein
MQKVLITGLALGNESGACSACNFDINWLFRHPCTLLWVDRVVSTNSIWDHIVNERYSVIDPKLRKTVKLVMEVLDLEGIIERVDSTKYIDSAFAEEIYKRIDQDLQRLIDAHGRGIDVDSEMRFVQIGKQEYCRPVIWSIYASVILSRMIDADCLHDSMTMGLCKTAFELSTTNTLDERKIELFQNVLKVNLPNEMIYPEILFGSTRCTECVHNLGCSDKYLDVVEKNLKALLTYRKYDEIDQLKGIIEKISANKDQGLEKTELQDLRKELEQKKRTIERRLYKRFPKVKRWANLLTMATVPLTIAGVISAQPLISIPALMLGGSAQFAKLVMENRISRANWLNFVNL